MDRMAGAAIAMDCTDCTGYGYIHVWLMDTDRMAWMMDGTSVVRVVIVIVIVSR